MNEQQLIQNFTFVLIQASLSFGIAIALTPVYTYFAFKFKLWKQIRTTTTTGEKAKVFTALHAAKHKRNIPTMAGIIMVIAISIVTLLLNLSRSQTYLPLFGLVAAGAIGLLDDFINIRGSGKGVAGLRSIIKFSLILLIATVGALYFFFRLGYSILHVPAVGDFDIGLLYIPLFLLVIVST
jgi:phospho-N-acetylmuramoyl-pentapeptide-transferase